MDQLKCITAEEKTPDENTLFYIKISFCLTFYHQRVKEPVSVCVCVLSVRNSTVIIIVIILLPH